MENYYRRGNLWENTPAELAIRKAMEEVEKMGADVKLTDAVMKLDEAFNLVADFTDLSINDKKGKPLTKEYLCALCNGMDCDDEKDCIRFKDNNK